MTRKELRKLQQALKEKGFNPGPLDGIWGKRTADAVVAFKKSVGLRARIKIGPMTRAALFDNRIEAPPSKQTNSYYRTSMAPLGALIPWSC